MRRWTYLAAGALLGAAVALAAGRPAEQDPVKLSPGYYTVRFENDRVRVLEYRLKPGEKEVQHSHPPGVVYLLADATLQLTDGNGKVSTADGKAGAVSWRDFTVHSAENIGKTEAHAIAIELKPCK